MTGATTSLDRALEAALTLGVLASFVLLVSGLGTGRVALLRAGIVILLMTPVVRVAVAAIGLGLRREWLFAVIALWILFVLASSMHVARFL